jgi:two-component system phosphate regulon sensor histidine kinase PhoR
MVEVSDESVVRPLRIRVDRIETAAESNLLLTIRDETEARRVDEIRREFVANVSHELKTPLAAIKGYAETVELALEDDPGAAAHFLSQIQSQCVRLERLVADMMQLARAQSGPTNLSPIEMTLGEIVAESLKSYQPVARAKGIELTVGDDGRAASVLADREATLTIANNLIGNAIRYTPDGGHVKVDVRGRDGFWALIVSDDGVGISQSEQERIFERFYRAERTRDTERGGTGLGLSIVKNLTLAQGGEVKLTSQPGVGSTFEVWLPAAAAASVPAS